MTQDTKTVLNVARRERLGKKVRALRREGMIPANIYGQHTDSTAVQLPADDLRHLMRGHGRNEIIYVNIEGEERPTFIRDIQRNPVTDQILHVDFMQISLKEKVRLEVPIHFTGVAPAVDTYSGILDHQLTQVMVEALPTNIPQFIELDVGTLTEIGQALHVSDLIAPEDTIILTDPELAVVRVDLPAAERSEEAPTAEAAEGAAPAEGAGPAASGDQAEGD